MNTNARNYSLDLLRLLATFMVVVLHVQLFGGLIRGSRELTVTFFPTVLLESFCIVAVNCFVLITGFFMIRKTMNWAKVLSLVLEIAVISWIIFAIGSACGLRAPFKELLQHLFPTLSGCHWFVSSYVILYILSPWINKFILSLTRQECFYLLGLLFVLFSIWGFNPKISQIGVQRGYSVLWLAYIYFIGSVIRLYAPRFAHPGIMYLLLSLLTVGYASVLCKFTFSIRWAMNYSSPLVLFASVALFYSFYRLQISASFVTKIIQFFTPGCFGVFLIHTDLFLRPLYKHLFEIKTYPFWLITIVGSAIIFVVSLLFSVYIHKMIIYVVNERLVPFIETRIAPPFLKRTLNK